MSPLPKLKDHCVLDSPDGLLLLQRDGNNAVCLLHPFTGQVAEFADLKCLAHQLSRHCQLYEMDHELIVNPCTISIAGCRTPRYACIKPASFVLLSMSRPRGPSR